MTIIFIAIEKSFQYTDSDRSMHIEILEENEQFVVHPGDQIALQWLEGQTIPFKSLPCDDGRQPLMSGRTDVIKTTGYKKKFKQTSNGNCRLFPVRLVIQQV